MSWIAKNSITGKTQLIHDFNDIERELQVKQIVFRKLGIFVRKILYKDGSCRYQLCYSLLYSLDISKEEYDLLNGFCYERG